MSHLKIHAINDTSNHSPGTNNTLLGTEASAVAEKAFGTAATASLIVQRDGVGDVIVPSSPSSSTAATSKTYVDDQISGRAKRTFVLQVFADDTDVITGDGKFHFIVPDDLDACVLLKAEAGTIVAGSTAGPMLIQLHNLRTGNDILSTRINVEASELHSKDATTQPVIDTANDDVATGDRIRIDVDAVCTTAHKGLQIILEFSVPSGSLSINEGIVTVSANTTLDGSHYTVLVDASGGARTITLPPVASWNGKKYTIKKIDSSTNTVTIDGNASETIRVAGTAATTQVLYIQGDFLGIQGNSTGGLWECVDDGLIPHTVVMTRDAAQSIANLVNVLIQFDTIVTDNAGLATTGASAKITIKRAGTYNMTMWWNTGSVMDDAEIAISFIFLGGSQIARANVYASGTPQAITPIAVATKVLAAAAEIQGYVLHSEGASINTQTSPNQPMLTLTEIR